MAVSALVENDGHSLAVRRWVDEFVIGLGFCPWARDADKARGIRVVTSSATDAEGILSDLMCEVGDLSCTGMRPPDREVTTTLLVCPHVIEWAAFDAFALFVAQKLSGGHELVHSHGVKIVAFHPQYTVHTTGFNFGDRVAHSPPGLPMVWGTVVAAAGDRTEEGEEVVQVKLDDGQEGFLLPEEIDYVAPVAEGLREPRSKAQQEADFALRAPRPVLHLLRCHDLALAEELGEQGSGPSVEAVLEQNAQRLRTLGMARIGAVLQGCG